MPMMESTITVKPYFYALLPLVPQAKKPGWSTNYFVLPHVDIVLHFNVEIYHFEEIAFLMPLHNFH